jgi:LEA14-like dessication related protein
MVTPETTEIKTVVAIYNPTILSRWLKKIEFDLYINGLKITSGTFENGVEVKPLGKTEVSLISFLNNSCIYELWVLYLKKTSLM